MFNDAWLLDFLRCSQRQSTFRAHSSALRTAPGEDSPIEETWLWRMVLIMIWLHCSGSILFWCSKLRLMKGIPSSDPFSLQEVAASESQRGHHIQPDIQSSVGLNVKDKVRPLSQQPTRIQDTCSGEHGRTGDLKQLAYLSCQNA